MPQQTFNDAKTPPPSICILRLSAIGDVTHVLPVVNALKTLQSKPDITWVIGKLEARLLAGVADVKFIVFDKNAGMEAVRQLKKALKQQRFDVLLHMQVALRANLLSRYVKAQTTIGWDKPRWRDRHQWFIKQSVRSVPRQHQVDGFLEFARILGAEPGRPVWNLPISDDDQHWADQTLAEGPDAGKPILMISPCSSHPLRNWAADRYASVANHAIANLGMRVVLVGGPSELELNTGTAIEAGVQRPLQNLIGKDTITQSVALLKRAGIVVSPDSGPAHIASALNVPVLGLYAATPSQRSGPYNSLELCVDKYAEAARKFKHKEAAELRWGQRIEFPGVMDLISVTDVLAQLDRFVQMDGFSQAQ